jgi:uncharacterized membrane protein YecN with MAPEG domain
MILNNVNVSAPLLTIVPVYAAIFGLMLVYLSFLVIKQRYRAKVSLGDGDDPALRSAIAVHSNFSQYVPLALLLITFVELNHAPAYLIHALGACLLVGRLAHAYGLGQAKQIMKLRRLGMVLTFSAIVIAALYLLASAI